MRDLNTEFKDTDDRLYAYEFDYILRRYMLKTFAPFFERGSALEMGCYHGEFTKHLVNIFDKVTVLEGSSDLMAKAKGNVNSPKADFINSTFEKADLTTKHDHIFLMHTLEHLDDAQLVLKKIKKWLAPGGRFFLVCPNANAASRQIAVRMGLIEHNQAVTQGEHDHGHRKTYSLDTLEAESRKAGFKTVSRGGVFFKPFANFQFDKMLAAKIIDEKYCDACYELGMVYPDLSASIYLVLE